MTGRRRAVKAEALLADDACEWPVEDEEDDEHGGRCEETQRTSEHREARDGVWEVRTETKRTQTTNLDSKIGNRGRLEPRNEQTGTGIERTGSQ
jgi:hypothetical protein